MPDTVQEILWWCLNGAIAIILFYVRNDLKEIKDELKDSRTRHDNHEVRITRLEVRCDILNCNPEGMPMRRVTDGILPENGC